MKGKQSELSKKRPSLGLCKLACLLIMFSADVNKANAQMWDAIAQTDYRIDSVNVRAVRVGVRSLAFFKDNEYSSDLTKGYSLPGVWVQPHVAYTPLRQIELQLGLHALIYDGANKYPCYAYHDIARWKGQQYQKGAHLLPFFRAQADFRTLTVVLGNLYGQYMHKLVRPLFNQEHNMSEDPETGLQLLWQRRRLLADTWLNWQSYIFEEDSHQEAFTVGASWHVRLGNMDSPCEWYLPVNAVVQHRGGEQDTTAMGVQTLCNGSVGAGMRWHAQRRGLQELRAEIDVLGCWQQSGELWPFDTGASYHVTAGANLVRGLGVDVGFYNAPRQFVSLYGAPFFTTVSLRDGLARHGLKTAYARADYHYDFGKDYSLGAEVEAYQCWTGRTPTKAAAQEFNFSFGIYLRVSPTIWRWKRRD